MMYIIEMSLNIIWVIKATIPDEIFPHMSYFIRNIYVILYLHVHVYRWLDKRKVWETWSDWNECSGEEDTVS